MNPLTTPQPGATSDAATIAALGDRASGEHKNSAPHGLPFVVIPNDHSVQYLAPKHAPAYPAGKVQLRDADSFVRYINRFEPALAPLIYASIDPAKFVCVLDEHQIADNTFAVDPHWREWRAEFTVPASREWLLWTNANRKQMSQTAFAEFLEDNLPDVIFPSGAELLEMALNFETTKTGAFRSVQRLQDGSVNFAWVDEVAGKDGGTVRMPPLITLAIPVFENEQPSELQARLKYRLHDGRLAIWFELVRPHKVLETAFRDVWARIEAGTHLKPLLGSPE